MIVRFVKLTFKQESVPDFLEIFFSTKEKIGGFPGCSYLNLLRGKDSPNVFFTHSIWESPEALEAYRQSELFQTTWAKTKVLFAEKAEAWSLGEERI